MIVMSKISNDKPHTIFKNYYDLALNNNQKSIENIETDIMDYDGIGITVEFQIKILRNYN